jgi:tetratricopeptide (TPR) repeat protein
LFAGWEKRFLLNLPFWSMTFSSLNQDAQSQRESTLLAEAVTMERRAIRSADWLHVAGAYGRLTTLDPNNYRYLGNLGNALWIADRPLKALAAYRQAILLAPENPVLFRGLGNVLTDLQHFEAADRAYALSSAQDGDPDTAWNHSQLLAGLEDYEGSYTLAERRWQLKGVEAWRDPAQTWRGQLECWRDHLLVWSEQGLGDTLQHLRWLGPLSKKRGPAAPPITLEVEACLVELFRQALSDLHPQPVVQSKPETGPAPPWSGWQVSMLSLPLLLGGAPIPVHSVWLRSPGWSEPRGQRRVGVVWAAGCKLSNPVTAREYERRSLGPRDLARLLNGLQELGCQPVLLQFGADREMGSQWWDAGVESLAEDANFAATAELVAGLDLVITVDTAMAHLVGAMQRPSWVLLPFSAAPRWLRKRTDSPWYPSLRLFRQPAPGEWQAVVEQVLKDLPIHLF